MTQLSDLSTSAIALLPHDVNPYLGVEIDQSALDQPIDTFALCLQHSIQQWQTAGYQLVWLHIPLAKSAHLPVAAQAGFIFHHSQPEYAMMVYRLTPDTLIPGYATHYIGIGGVVLTEADDGEEREILVVSERHRRSAAPHYKLPGGALHAREHLAEAVVREVEEETGVQSKFESVVCLRHWHGYRYGRSDIYFVARLRALTRTITIQEEEIEEALWMPVKDYLTHPHASPFNRRIVQAAIDTPGFSHEPVVGYANPEAREFLVPEAKPKNEE